MEQKQSPKTSVSRIVCAQESLDLLNCVTETPYDQEKCLRLLSSLRDCVLSQKVKKFSLTEQHNSGAKSEDILTGQAQPAASK